MRKMKVVFGQVKLCQATLSWYIEVFEAGVRVGGVKMGSDVWVNKNVLVYWDGVFGVGEREREG